jgi:hypothetical protein
MEIGGYFGLELHQGNEAFHVTPYRFKSGRASLGFILKHLKPTNVYVPFYTCNALLAPFHEHNIPYTFYKINNDFELVEWPKLKADELIVYINYFDIKRAYAQQLSDHYQHQLITDCTQAYFLNGNDQSWFFNSSRKFFGVPDGSDLYAPKGQLISEAYAELTPNVDFLTDHLVARFNGNTRQGYEYFKRNDELCGQGIYQMSELASCLLSNINYDNAASARKNNFDTLHQQLADSNRLNIEENNAASFYPYLPGKLIDKQQFWQQDVFIPIFWPDCINRDTDDTYITEKTLSKYIIPVPIDHRYDSEDMHRIINIIKELN